MTKVRFGFIKVCAHRFMRGEAIPVFRDRSLNRAIDAHANRIRAARTRRPKRGALTQHRISDDDP